MCIISDVQNKIVIYSINMFFIYWHYSIFYGLKNYIFYTHTEEKFHKVGLSVFSFIKNNEYTVASKSLPSIIFFPVSVTLLINLTAEKILTFFCYFS